MLAPAVSPLCPQPRPSSQSPSPCLLPALAARFPHGWATLRLCHLSAVSPCFSPLPCHSVALHLAPHRSHLHWFLIVGHWCYWERPRMAFEAGSAVALRYEDKAAQLGSGTTCQWGPAWWEGQDGPRRWGWQRHQGRQCHQGWQRAPPQPAAPLLSAEGPATLSPAGAVPGTRSPAAPPQPAAVPRGG